MTFLNLKLPYLIEVRHWQDYSEEKRRSEIGRHQRKKILFIWGLIKQPENNEIPGTLWPSELFKGYED